MTDKAVNSPQEMRRQSDRNPDDYTYQVATIVAALLLVLSATV